MPPGTCTFDPGGGERTVETAIQQSSDVRRTLGSTHLEALPSSPGDADGPLAISCRTALLSR